MHAYLIISPNRTSRDAYIAERLSAQSVSTFDTLQPDADEGSTGISRIREFIRLLSLSPVAGDTRAGVIADGNALTVEAQQALLKTIEEPPAHTIIYIGASHASALLPTIVSRCETVILRDTDTPADPAVSETVTDLLSASPGNRVAILGRIGKTKEDYLSWIDRATATVHMTLKSNPEDPTASILIRGFLEARRHATYNVHPLLSLERLFLSLS